MSRKLLHLLQDRYTWWLERLRCFRTVGWRTSLRCVLFAQFKCVRVPAVSHDLRWIHPIRLVHGSTIQCNKYMFVCVFVCVCVCVMVFMCMCLFINGLNIPSWHANTSVQSTGSRVRCLGPFSGFNSASEPRSFVCCQTSVCTKPHLLTILHIQS